MGRQTPEPLARRLTKQLIGNTGEGGDEYDGAAGDATKNPAPPSAASAAASIEALPRTARSPETSAPKTANSRAVEALKQLFCGGAAGAVAKTITAPLSRLTILYQVHPMVTTKENRPRFSMSIYGGLSKIVDRGGVQSLWRGNGTSVLHRFPFSAINFYCYEATLDAINGASRLSDEDEDDPNYKKEVSTWSRFVAGATAGCTACVACYPLDLIRTRLTTQFDGKEHYRGITDALLKIVRSEGVAGLYSGLAPTLMVAAPSFAISYMVYGSLKEYALDDDLFLNFRRVDALSGEEKLGFRLTLMFGAASGTLSTLVTFPFDTARRRMQIQSLHYRPEECVSASKMILNLFRSDGIRGFYRGLPPEVLKVVPMVGSMFCVYEYLKDQVM